MKSIAYCCEIYIFLYTFLNIFVYFCPGEAFADFLGADLVIGRPSLSGVLEQGLKGPRYRVQP